MRKRIFEIIEVAESDDLLSKVYDIFMMLTIIFSLVPLAMKNPPVVFVWLDKAAVTIFIADYILRLLTADYKLRKGAFSFIRYPFTFMAIVDLLSILPSLIMMNGAFRVLKVFRLLRTFRVFRVFKAFRYSKNIQIIVSVFRKQIDSLLIVGCLAVGYIIISAMIVFNIEPDTFPSFFDAVYWATVSLTTVGYGDIYAVSDVGKFMTMLSSLFGIAIIALPSGIITAGYMKEISPNDEQEAAVNIK